MSTDYRTVASHTRITYRMIQSVSNEDIVKVGHICFDIEMKYRIPTLRFISMLLIVETALLS
jgi:hypothetical protein